MQNTLVAPRCPSLLEMSRNVIRTGVRARFLLGVRHFERDFEERWREYNRVCTVYEETPPLYNFSSIFLHAIEPYVQHNILQPSANFNSVQDYMEILEFISPEHELQQSEKLNSYNMGMHKLDGPVKYERFIQFIEWVQLVQPAVVKKIIQNSYRRFQIMMFRDNFSMENFRLALQWDQQYEGAVLFNDNDSHLHFMLGRRTLGTDVCDLLMDKLQEIVAVYGDKYLMHVPASDMYASDTLVAALLYESDNSDFHQPIHTILEYLIHKCPAALKIKSRCIYRDNAFAALCERWNDARILRHVWMVDNVMRYADITDIMNIVSNYNMTLLQYAQHTKNNLVLDYIRLKFHVGPAGVGVP